MAIQTSEQVKDYLLCRDCEELFNTNGERWMLARCYRDTNGDFRLREYLAGTPPFLSLDGHSAFNTSQISSIDHSKLVYYAISFFWRAAVHSWRVGRETIEPIELGPYQERMRRFLLGEEELHRCIYLSVWLSNRERPVPVANVPTSYHIEDGGIMHRMNLPGIAFLMTIGKRVGVAISACCILHSPERPMFVSRHVDDQLMSNLLATIDPKWIGQ